MCVEVHSSALLKSGFVGADCKMGLFGSSCRKGFNACHSFGTFYIASCLACNSV